MTPKIPRGQFGEGYDGTSDPEQFTPAERMTTDEARLVEERERRDSMSPVVRAMQAATDKALGRTK